MAVRREAIDIAVSSNLAPVAIRDAAALKALIREADRLGKSSVQTERAGQRMATGLDKVGNSSTRTSRSVRDVDSSINQLTGRIRVIADIFAILGPAIAPIGAIAVPAVTGLANQLGFAAAAGGTAILAFQGVADAVGAMNDYALEPSAANLEKVHLQLSRLSPQAADFAREIGAMRSQLLATRDAAAEGLFPELTPALDDLDGLLARVQPMLTKIGAATGSMLADGLESLNSERWQGFFDFLGNEADSTLSELGATVGGFTHGLAELWQAFQPLNSDFSGWLRRIAGDFDAWSAGLDQTQGFNEFVAYVRENGPQVADTMSALGRALLDIAEAAAPLGGPVLIGLEAFARIVSSIADSDIGTPLIGLALAMGTLNRALAVSAAMSRFSLANTTAGRAMDSTRTSAMGLRSSLAAVSAQYMTAQQRAQTSATAHQAIARNAEEARKNLRGMAGTAGKAAAGIGALALVSTDAGQSLGVQNAAMLGLMGAMAGPWGAAAGVAVGALIDMKSAQDDAAASARTLDTVMRGSDFTGITNGIASAREEAESLGKTASMYGGIATGLFSTAGGGLGLQGFTKLFGGDEAVKLNDQADAADRARDAYMSLAAELTTGAFNVQTPFGSEQVVQNTDAFAETLERLGPTLQRMGVDFGDLQNMSLPELRGLAGDVRAFVQESDSVEGRTRAVGDSIRELGNDALVAADSAAAMGAALDALLSPTLEAEEATHAWRETLASLRTELIAGAGFSEYTKAGRENAAMTRDVLASTKTMLTARAAAGASEREIAGLVQESRREFIRHGIAAGIDADVIRRRADYLGLTPKLVRTTFQAAGVGRVEQQARNLRGTFRGLPKEVRTMVRTGNLPRTEGDINRLIRKYPRLEKNRTALIRLRDLASRNLNGLLRGLGVADKRRANPRADLNRGAFDRKIAGMERSLGAVDRKRTNPGVDVNTSAANRKLNETRSRLTELNNASASPRVSAETASALQSIGSVQGALSSLRDRTVTVTTVQRTRRENAMGGYWPAEAAGFALGGMIQTEAGDRRNAHQAEFAGPGPTRVWREEETGGESYIPHANDYRRPGARAIAEQTVRLFGGQVDWYARGGWRPGEREGLMSARQSAGGQVAYSMRGGSLRVTGVLDTPWGPAKVRGIARAEARDAAERVVEETRSADDAHAYAQSGREY